MRGGRGLDLGARSQLSLGMIFALSAARTEAGKDALILARAAMIAQKAVRISKGDARPGDPPRTPDKSRTPPSRGQRNNRAATENQPGPRAGTVGRKRLRKRYAKVRIHLVTFLDHPEVVPDDNRSERELHAQPPPVATSPVASDPTEAPVSSPPVSSPASNPSSAPPRVRAPAPALPSSVPCGGNLSSCRGERLQVLSTCS